MSATTLTRIDELSRRAIAFFVGGWIFRSFAEIPFLIIPVGIFTAALLTICVQHAMLKIKNKEEK